MKSFVVPIENSGKKPIRVEIEPEGDWFPLDVGETCEVRFELSDNQEFDLELEIQDEFIFLHCSAHKEVLKNTRKE
jgi:hypothetical protein